MCKYKGLYANMSTTTKVSELTVSSVCNLVEIYTEALKGLNPDEAPQARWNEDSGFSSFTLYEALVHMRSLNTSLIFAPLVI
jgi:hypothetical protein